MREKSEIRRRVKELRAAMGESEKAGQDGRIYEKVVGLSQIERADCVYCYVSTEKEADTRRLLEYFWLKGKRMAAPRVEGKQMDFYFVSSFADLSPGCMGILEPRSGCERAEVLDCPVIVPGLAFDPMGGRIGYGGGYYDRFFEREPEHRRIGIAYGFQVFENLPLESHDRRMDELITP